MNSKYAPIARHLQAQTDDLVTLGFSEIEAILGFPLPPSARQHGPWWSNASSNAVWVPAGWLSEGRDMRAERVSFRRGSPRERAAPTKGERLARRPAFDGTSLAESDFAPACDITVRFRWRHLGPVVRDEEGRLVFPAAPAAPGLYRMRVRGQIYVGEAVNLRRRFRDYRQPGSTQQTSQRISAILREALAAGAPILLDVAFEDVALSIAGEESRAGLANKAVRRLAEQAAIVAHGGIDVELLNR